MGNVALGKYIPGNSYIHHIDPRVKILCMIAIMVCIFVPAGFVGYGVLAAFIALCIWNAGLSLKFLFKALKPMFFMMVFLFVINLFVVKTGEVVLTVGTFKIYEGALQQTVYIVVRLTLMIFTTTILTSTTKPLDLTLGIEDLMSPFAKIGFPAHEIAMMISIALRFIPTLIEEMQRIMKAQASRGVDFKEGKFAEKIKAILSLIVPLFVASFQCAEDLANAMEARGYVPDGHRTRFKQLHITSGDVLAFIIVYGMMAGIIAYAVIF